MFKAVLVPAVEIRANAQQLKYLTRFRAGWLTSCTFKNCSGYRKRNAEINILK